MIIFMDSVSGVQSITFLGKPNADFYPLDQFPSSKKHLPGFNWQDYLKPKRLEYKTF
jgi:hypothetical protein